MRKKICLFFLILVCFALFSTAVYAKDLDDYYTELKIPDEVSERLNIGDNDGVLAYSDILDYIKDKVSEYIFGPVSMCVSLIAVLVISSLYHNLSHLLAKKRMEAAFSFVVNIVCTFGILYFGYDCISISEGFVAQIADFSASLSPVISAVCLSSGRPNTSMVLGTGISLFCGLCEGTFVLFLFPLVKAILLLGSLVAINDDTVDIRGVIQIIKKVFSTILGFTVMLYGCILTTQKLSAGAVDSMSFRSVRFALSSIVPVVGASLGEASRSVVSSLGVIRESIGGIGIAVILLLILPCVIRIIINRFLLYGCAAVARMLSCKREADMLENVAGAWGYCLALVSCSGFMLIFVLAVFSRITVAL